MSKFKHSKNHLSIVIQPKIDKDLHRKIYRIVIDGDVFWADNYAHAVLLVIEIHARDEFGKSKIMLL